MSQPIPLIGFVKGDTLGLVVLGSESETLRELAAKLQRAADVRVPASAAAGIYYQGKKMDPDMTLLQAGLEPLSRFDVVPEEDR